MLVSAGNFAFCIWRLLRRVTVIFLEVFFKNSRILEFSISEFQDPGVFNLKTPGSWSFCLNSKCCLLIMKRFHNFYDVIVLGVNKACLFRSWTLFLFWILVATCNYHFWWIFFQNSRTLEFWDWKLQDPGVLRSKTPESWRFWKMLHQKWWFHVATIILYKNKVHDRNRHALLPGKGYYSKKYFIFWLFRDTISR